MPKGTVVSAVAGLLLNALVWGTSWWPFRRLQAEGLHPLWATAFIYLVAVAVIVAFRPSAPAQMWRTPTLWLLLLASGITNAAFNWASVIGDVVRVVLLFYLCPVWTVLLARVLLGEAIGPAAVARVALAMVGAVLLLWPGLGAPSAANVAHAEQVVGAALAVDTVAAGHWLPDALSSVGAFTFALTNVLLRREGVRSAAAVGAPGPVGGMPGAAGAAPGAAAPPAARAFAMFAGGMLVSSLVATGLARHGAVPWPAAPGGWWPLAVALAALFLFGNLALQHGAARLPANVTSLVMLSEVLFATASAWWWNAAAPTGVALIGGGCIIAAAALAATVGRRPAGEATPVA